MTTSLPMTDLGKENKHLLLLTSNYLDETYKDASKDQ